MERAQWLSEGVEKLAFELLAHAQGDEPHCDVVIVGSGYGGAVAAARFAGATPAAGGEPIKVWLLERGREFLPGAFPERFSDLPGHLRIDSDSARETWGLGEGLFDLRLGEDVSALLGNGLGGGSLINAGVLARPDRAAFERHFGAVEKMLGAAPLPGPAPAKLAALGELAAQIDGARAERARIAVTFEKGKSFTGVAQDACLRCADCMTGCNHRAKNTLAMNYLPLARLRGARLFTGVTVDVIDGSDGAWSLALAFTDRQIRERFGEMPRLRARRVILAAGTYGSTAILMRSRDGGFERLSDRLGEGFSTNGDMIAAAVGMPSAIRASAEENVPPAERRIGPTITGIIDARHKEVPVVIEELAIPAALRRVFEEVVTSFGALHDLGRIDRSEHHRGPGRDPAAIDADAIERTAVYATFGDDGAKGRIVLRAPRDADRQGDRGVCVEWKDVAGQPVFAEAMALLKKAHGKNATLIPNPMWKLLPSDIGGALEGGEIGGAVFTVHPLGGCTMAGSAQHGVVNALGQAFLAKHGEEVHRTLVVLDGSIVPAALGTNPCLTIAALAEHAVEQLASQEGWKLNLADQGDAAIEALPALPDPPSRHGPWRAPEPTAIRLAERLKGTLTLDHCAYDATLEIEYETLPDLEKFLRGPSRVLPIRRARLHLLSAATGDETLVQQDFVVTLAGELTLLEREATTLWRRLRAAVWAWLINRGTRDLFAWLRRKLKDLLWFVPGLAKNRPKDAGEKHNGKKKKAGPGILGTLRGWIAVASHAGERRLLRYHLAVTDVPARHAGKAGRPIPLRPGDCLHGTKTIAYVAKSTPACPWPSLWDQLTRLPLVLGSDQADPSREIGCLEVDLPYFVQQHATQLQIAAQDDQPRALADLYSLFAYIARVVGKIHIWSFRAPDYPDPYPTYEFDAAEREKARKAAAEVRITTTSRLEYRRPRDIGPFNRDLLPRRRRPRRPELFKRTVLPLDAVDGQADPKAAFLTHYTRARPRRNARARPAPVLLIHGLGAGGNTFTVPTIKRNLVQHLMARDYDPWVLDLRTSIGVPSSKEKWEFDDVARLDIPRAIDKIREATGCEKVDVVAHCIGAAMFCMAALEGALDGRVRAAVLSQVGPLLELPPTNRFRGYAASYLKHYLDVDELDTAATLTPRNRFLDRLLATLPYPLEEWTLHKHGVRPVTHEAYCLRAYGIYGRLFEHRNMNAATLNVLGDYLGHLKYQTYQQTIFYATMRRLTDADGGNRYVTYDNIERRLNFPICFLHGARNEVFDKKSSRRSFDLLASIFWSEDLRALWESDPERRYDYRLYGRGKRLRIVEIEGFGHQDCMIGANAYREVYPKISSFLEDCEASSEVSPAPIVVRPPRMGPIVGWVREAENGEHVLARILFVPNDSRSTPDWAMSIVLKAGRQQVESARFHALQPGGAERPETPGQGQTRPQTQTLDVELPREPADYRIVVLTVHKEQFEPEPSREAGEPRGDDPFGEDLDRFPVKPAELPRFDGQDAGDCAEDVLRTCKDLGMQREPLPTGRHVNHRRYAAPVSAAIVSREVMAAARAAQPADASLRFALASCRYAATIADREAADAAFGRLRGRLEGPREGRPQLLILAGDNIYADATHGIFDPTAPSDRYDQRYLEAWTAPNAREVLRRLPLYPMLDDHEVAENFEGYRTEHEKGLKAFESFQLRLSPAFKTVDQSRPNGSRYAYELGAGGFEFFVADTRARRKRKPGKDSVGGTIIDGGQMRDLQAWLKKRQDADPAMPKFVVSPSVVAPWSRESRGHIGYALRSDAWDGFPVSLQELLNFIADNRIRNVVFLSGDYHCSLFCRLELIRDGAVAASAYSIVSSGLYAPFPFANTRIDALELEFSGAYRQRLGDDAPPKPGELVIEYRTTRACDRDAFAVVDVKPQGAGWRMQVEFDTDRGPVTENVLLTD
jgi:cholesterol oxidase